MSIRRIAQATTVGLFALALAACGAEGTAPEEGPGDSDVDAGEGAPEDGDGGAAEDLGTITLTYLPSWTDGLSTAYLLDNLLTEAGYTIEHQTVEDAAFLYTGLAEGDVDLYASAWSERTHAKYMDEYADDLEDLGWYYEGASLHLSVPEYTDIDSIDELLGKGDQFGGQIVGIEPGAGLTDATENDVIPGYDLGDEYKLVTSSTATMLTELGEAIDNEEDIVVTLWSPFWANSEFPVKALDDPEGAFGESENLHWLARDGFTADFPEAAEIIGKIKLDDDQYGSLENMVVNEYDDGQEAEAVAAWIELNQDLVDSFLN